VLPHAVLLYNVAGGIHRHTCLPSASPPSGFHHPRRLRTTPPTIQYTLGWCAAVVTGYPAFWTVLKWTLEDDLAVSRCPTGPHRLSPLQTPAPPMYYFSPHILPHPITSVPTPFRLCLLPCGQQCSITACPYPCLPGRSYWPLRATSLTAGYADVWSTDTLPPTGYVQQPLFCLPPRYLYTSLDDYRGVHLPPFHYLPRYGLLLPPAVAAAFLCLPACEGPHSRAFRCCLRRTTDLAAALPHCACRARTTTLHGLRLRWTYTDFSP